MNNTKFSKWEYIVPLFTVVSLLTSSVIVSGKKYFWNDEFLSFYLLNDPSFTHMIAAWSDTFNQAPPLYFILGWLWSKIFGATEVSLRLFSSLTLCLAFIIIWITLRRTYDFWSTVIGTTSVFCLSTLVLYHNAEVRMYGLFTAFCALGFLLYDIIIRRKNISSKILVLNTIIHGLIVLTHLYGGFYSAAILIATFIRDKYLNKIRVNVYLSIICGWLFLFPLLPLMINQSNNHAKWIASISLVQVINYLIFTPKFALFILTLLIISIFLNIIHPSIANKNRQSEYNFQSDFHLLILAVMFMAVPVITWFITQTVKPIFGERYIIPTITIGWTILLSYLCTKIFPYLNNIENLFFDKNKTQCILVLTLSFLLIIYPLKYATRDVEAILPNSYLTKPGIEDERFGYTALPIATEAGHNFLPRFYYSPKSERYFHILDWETALNNKESAFATGDYTHMSALKRHYPFINSVQSRDFLTENTRFLVLNEPKNVISWFEERIQNTSLYKITLLGKVDGGYGYPLELFLVESKSLLK
ncbi:glycosyltransferase family 39 protein [Anabaena subtropica]|uniref:Glycosyltransferase family 39 protein n=1 Tax=Anabaena subtropica FACHB-260 TaxID=2692884 RepID=A0ABR8CJK1_9NOST|nr:glycosyltransferase family 39 protein [Anabaena subtropica]MBD2343411.1 glycosyltransferase family 39 protein [Anabaena subtropica FACHB-260]